MAHDMLMIHGVGCGGQVWDRMRADFTAAGFTCHAPTLFSEHRTRTNPPQSLRDLRLEDYIEAMAQRAQTLAQARGEKPIIIGHSMGGLIAQHLTAGGLARAAIFLTPAQPEGCTVTDLRVMRSFWNIFKVGRKNIPGGVFKVGPKGFSWGVLNAVEPQRHAAIYATALYDSGHVFMDLAQPKAVDTSCIHVPTLTIGAKQDRATVIKAVRKVAQKYASAPLAGTYIEYPDNAHWIVDEPGTTKVSADIIDWLGTVLAP